ALQAPALAGLAAKRSGWKRSEPRRLSGVAAHRWPSYLPGPARLLSQTLAADLARVGADVAEGVAGIGAERGHGRDAHDDDQSEHDGVFDRGRAVFVLQEADQVLTELTHGVLSFS